MDRGAWQATVHGVTRVRHDLATDRPWYKTTEGFYKLFSGLNYLTKFYTFFFFYRFNRFDKFTLSVPICAKQNKNQGLDATK